MHREDLERLAIAIQRDLYHFALTLCGNEQDAADLVQDTFLKALKSHAGFRDGTNFRAWMFRIARNAFIDMARRRKFQANYDFEAEEVKDESIETEAKDITDALPDEISNAFRGLDPQSRAIVMLADIQRFSYKEISETLDVPIGTCMSRLFRARKKLQSLILQNRSKSRA
jgi:RNA polymerase sigma-70 factor (ECF subfamily)